MKQANDTIVITQERMMGWLCFNRFHCLEVKSDLKNPDRNIYVFKDSLKLRDTMEKYQQFKELV
ncbi:MAG TPA: hypothetical protein VF941_13800 [Clostridia bacterium]